MRAASGQDRIAGAGPATLPWLRALVQEILQLPESEVAGTRTLRELGAGSLQTVALQFRILQETSVSVEISELVGDAHLADLATLIDVRRPPA
ncbi:acyl carrier protein [Streptomyces sp. NPDC005423]|uniref:acyl carrier protein n=1 Tax=Streptomyces sp. NPDC005423 TaxID=3155343 RepID=UPI0033AD2701